ncbi:hypothetical protein V1525DRAFT_7303 [Lipomyces kononenkoae]|uniref:Uncharacterized protein n=1 Tax=Lipomyces kononenkoae TaxID=34357 RepID=A0ACC3TC47_LIPKO
MVDSAPSCSDSPSILENTDDSVWDLETFILWIDVRKYWIEDTVEAEERFAKALTLVAPEEQTSLRRFHFRRDAAQHLASLLLQHLVICQLADVPWVESRVSRTLMGRPFHEQARFDYNVSHHSGRVAIGVRVADQRHIGIDVVDPEDATRNWKPGWIDDFHDIFTESEYAQILRDGKKEDGITKRRLFTYWALKEAYTKATGIGLVSDLKSIEFSKVEDVDINEKPYTRSTICKVNNGLIDWRFEIFALEGGLVLASATTNEGLFTQTATTVKEIDFDYITKIAVQYHLPTALTQNVV